MSVFISHTIYSIIVYLLINVLLVIGKQTKRQIDNYIFRYHQPESFTPALPLEENGTVLAQPDATPDFRIEEPPFFPYKYPFGPYYMEEERPYKMSPHTLQASRWAFTNENPYSLICYCTTVYKKFTVLAGCAMITIRHALTTATSTQLVLRTELPKIKGKKFGNLAGIIGIWYDSSTNTANSSRYVDISRIHIHPMYLSPDQVNITHPIPCYYDLAVWTTVAIIVDKSAVCTRGGPHAREYVSSTPRKYDLAIIIGFQFIKAYRRNPLPWFKYAVRTRKHIVPCPKTEWGWFHCILGRWAKFGLDSGAAWHRALANKYYLYDGLIGLNAFSTNLRSEELTHYFTVINTHRVLDFLVQSYEGRIPYAYLDGRFEDTKTRSPIIKPQFSEITLSDTSEDHGAAYKYIEMWR